jgi:hypothetical protein
MWNGPNTSYAHRLEEYIYSKSLDPSIPSLDSCCCNDLLLWCCLHDLDVKYLRVRVDVYTCICLQLHVIHVHSHSRMSTSISSQMLLIYRVGVGACSFLDRYLFRESRYDIPVFTMISTSETINELTVIASEKPGGLETRLGNQHGAPVWSHHMSAHVHVIIITSRRLPTCD